MKYLLLLSLVGCFSKEVTKGLRVHKDLCVAQCILNNRSSFGTGTSETLKEACKLKYKHLNCCESKYSHDYYNKCVEYLDKN